MNQPLKLTVEHGYYKDYGEIDKVKNKKLTVTMTVNNWHTLQQVLAWEIVHAMMELEEEPGSININYPHMLRRIGKHIEKQTGLINEAEREYEEFGIGIEVQPNGKN